MIGAAPRKPVGNRFRDIDSKVIPILVRLLRPIRCLVRVAIQSGEGPNMQRLPKVLEREPLVDAIFEVRLNGTSPLGDILPGALFGGITPKPIVERLPAAEFPYPIRANDPNLQFAPVSRLDLGQYHISVSDRSFFISCKLPYPKWPAFKEKIVEITRQIASFGIPGSVERYSIKYVNLIEAPSLDEQISKVNLSLKLGSLNNIDSNVNLRLERNNGETLHIVSIVTGAQGVLADGRSLFGVVVDIDSIRNVRFESFNAFADIVENGVEELRQANKAQFFDCLKEEAVQAMGPVYESN